MYSRKTINFRNIIFKKKFLLTYSTNLLLSNYTHIGFKKSLVVNSFRKAILGFYSGISIINPTLTLAGLRFVLNFLARFIIKNQKICFVSYNFPEGLKEKLFIKNQFYFLNYWVSGSLTNFKFVRHFLDPKKSFCPYFPSASILFGLEPKKAGEISLEANKVLIPCFVFIDSNTSPLPFQYWIPMNSKSGYTKLFFVRFINSFCIRFFKYKKFFFLSRVLKIRNVLLRRKKQNRMGKNLRKYRSFRWLRYFKFKKPKGTFPWWAK